MVKKILIIDDEVNFGKLVKKNLELSGNLKVEVAVNGNEGIRLASRLKPHLILLDILMPDMDGFQVLDKLKKNVNTALIPVILLSAKGDNATRIQASSKDVELFITKPIGSSELKDKIIKILKSI
ncbi:MAG: response regulator [Candidatus Omnitrophica bacterium]|nr:response regulator [Candidatus Omnitrophota bacterium]MDD5691457.1 response regulator [Candidatus Omnitrophota bacterium]